MGIADIRSAFAKAAPGIDLRAVRMRYDLNTSEQVLEFDIRQDGVERTVEERLSFAPGTKPMLDAAMKIAKSLGATVEVEENTETLNKASSLMSEVVGGDAPVLKADAVTVEHEGETYELAVDDKPKALFF
jgi:hypothetical protein